MNTSYVLVLCYGDAGTINRQKDKEARPYWTSIPLSIFDGRKDIRTDLPSHGDAMAKKNNVLSESLFYFDHLITLPAQSLHTRKRERENSITSMAKLKRTKPNFFLALTLKPTALAIPIIITHFNIQPLGNKNFIHEYH